MAKRSKSKKKKAKNKTSSQSTNIEKQTEEKASSSASKKESSKKTPKQDKDSTKKKGNKAKKKQKKKKDGSKETEQQLYTPPDAAFSKQTVLFGSILALLCLVIYILTLCPTVPGGDSSELITVAYTLGIAHPPGYPLFTLLGKLFTFIPYGSVAWRVNFFSAFCDTMAAVFIFLAVVRWSRNVWAGFLAGGLFAFSPLIWRYAVIAEVFALNNFFAALMIYLVIRYWQQKEIHIAYLGAFLLGLGLTNHQTLLFYGLPLVLFVWWVSKGELLKLKRFGTMAVLFFAGLSPYLYLSIASLRIPEVSWGNSSSLYGLFTHITRKEYGTFQLFADDKAATPLKGVFYYLAHLPNQLLYVGVLLAIFGLIHALKKEKGLGFTWWCLISFSFYVVVFHIMANLPLDDKLHFDVHTRFWQMANVMIFIWVGIGSAALLSKLPKFQTAAGAVLALGLIFGQVYSHYEEEDQSQNRTFEHFARATLAKLPKKALLFVAGDIMSNPTRYLQHCEGFRKDLMIIDRELLKAPWYKRVVQKHFPSVKLPGKLYGYKNQGGFNIQEFFDANIDEHLIFVNELSKDGSFEKDDLTWKKKYKIKPHGFLDQIVFKKEELDLDGYLKSSLGGTVGFTEKHIKRHEKGSWEKLVWNVYWNLDHRRGHYILNYALKHGRDQMQLAASLKIFEDLYKRHPNPMPALIKNLGLNHFQLYPSRPKTAIADTLKYWKLYLANPLKNEPDLEKLQTFIKKYDKKPPKKRK